MEAVADQGGEGDAMEELPVMRVDGGFDGIRQACQQRRGGSTDKRMREGPFADPRAVTRGGSQSR